MRRITISVTEELAQQFDDLIERHGYENRSEAFRDLLRARIEDERKVSGWTALHGVATVTYIYNFHERDLGNGESHVDPDPAKREYAKADAMADALRQDFAVPVKWIEPGSRDTAENAAFSVRMLKADGVKRILLVTDAMHMPRARVAFQRAGIEVVDAPTMFFRGQAVGPSAWIPGAEGMRRSWYAVYELIGIAWYDMREGSKKPASAPAIAPPAPTGKIAAP